MSEQVRPIYARAFFSFSSTGNVDEYLVFYYYDPEAYYAGLDAEGIRKEEETVKENLQSFLDEERIVINGQTVRARVLFARIGLLTVNYPFIEFLINFRGRVSAGVNTYENEYEEETAEYPYEAVWVFPGEVVDYQLAGKVEVQGNALFLRVTPGTKTGGREWIKFKLGKS